MSEKQKGKPRKVVYRKRHKSLTHLTEDGTKHAFDERIRGELRHLSSEPVYLGVSSLSAADTNTFFETVTVDNYQEISKQMDISERRSSSNRGTNRVTPRMGKRRINRRHPHNRPLPKEGTRYVNQPPIEDWFNTSPNTFMEEQNLATHDNTSDLNSQSTSSFPSESISSDQILLGPYHTSSMPVLGFPLLLPEHPSPLLPHHCDGSPSEMIVPRYPNDGELQYMDLCASIHSMVNYSTVDGGQLLPYFNSTSFPDRH